MLSTKDISTLLLFTPQGVNKWKKENRPIISLLQKYFTSDNLQEFLKTEKITKMERLNIVNDLEIELENLFLENFTLSGFDFQQFSCHFVENSEIEIKENNVRELFYEFIIKKQHEIEAEIQEEEYWELFPQEEPPSAAFILSHLFNTLNKFSDRELKFYINMNYQYNPLRDSHNPA